MQTTKSFWTLILDELHSNRRVALLYVVESMGSSPGRQGFKMTVFEDETLHGSIGGGIMEHKFVEVAKDKLAKNDNSVLLKKQIHSDSVNENKSGMICSGEQTICILLIDSPDKTVIQSIILALEQGENHQLVLSQEGLQITANSNSKIPFSFVEGNEWKYSEDLNFKSTIHIIGAGHVGLALSQQMKWLGFDVVIYDDREKLNTLTYNDHADQKVVIDYHHIGEQIPEGDDYVVLVSFGYRTDKKILQQLLNKSYKYLGMMGSKSKTTTLMKELLAEGFGQEQLSAVHAPIGIDIQSKTPEEIAVSIAAQIIDIKNKS